MRAYRNRLTGEVVALSEPGLVYRADGQHNGSAGIFDAEGCWTSSLVQKDGAVVGCPISPWGFALQEEVRLPTDDWSLVLMPNSPCLDIHIPSGSPMDFEHCGDSLRQALEFFPRHFPDKPFVGLACHSWILDNQFPDLLPPSSNLVRFEREGYLFPVARSGGAIRAVFGYGFAEEEGTVSADDLARLPRRTGMQKAFAEHMNAGGRFRGGGFFLLNGDLAWGKQVYRQGWPPDR